MDIMHTDHKLQLRLFYLSNLNFKKMAAYDNLSRIKASEQEHTPFWDPRLLFLQQFHLRDAHCTELCVENWQQQLVRKGASSQFQPNRNMQWKHSYGQVHQYADACRGEGREGQTNKQRENQERE